MISTCRTIDTGGPVVALTPGGLGSGLRTEISSGASVKKELTVAMPAHLGDYAPFGVAGGGRNYVRFLIYDHLIVDTNIAENAEDMQLQMAKTLTKIDERTYDVEIYDYIHDSIGNPITADDVVFCLEEADRLKANARFSAAFDYIRKTGEYSVRVGIKNTSPGTGGFVIGLFPIVSRKSYESQSKEEHGAFPIGAGPYIVSEVAPGSHISFVRNENYWQNNEELRAYVGHQPAEKITLKCINDHTERAKALLEGQVNIAQNIRKAELVNFVNEDGSAREGYNVKAVLSGNMGILELNVSESSPTANQALRQAILYAIDNEEMMHSLMGNNAIRAKTPSSPLAIGYIERWNSEDYYDFNLEKAKAKLAESGFKPGRVKLRLLTAKTRDRSYLACGPYIRDYLAKIGIEVEVMNCDDAVYNKLRLVPEAWDLMLRTQGSAGYVTETYSLLFDRKGFKHGGAENFAHDDKLQQLYESACFMETFSEETVDALHQYVKEKAYFYGLHVDYNIIIGDCSVKKIVCHPWAVITPSACQFY